MNNPQEDDDMTYSGTMTPSLNSSQRSASTPKTIFQRQNVPVQTQTPLLVSRESQTTSFYDFQSCHSRLTKLDHQQSSDQPHKLVDSSGKRARQNCKEDYWDVQLRSQDAQQDQESAFLLKLGTRKSERLVGRASSMDLGSKYVKESSKYPDCELNGAGDRFKNAPSPPVFQPNSYGNDRRSFLPTFKNFFDQFRIPRGSEAGLEIRRSIRKLKLSKQNNSSSNEPIPIFDGTSESSGEGISGSISSDLVGNRQNRQVKFQWQQSGLLSTTESQKNCPLRSDLLDRINQALRMLNAHIWWVGVFAFLLQFSFVFPWITSECKDQMINYNGESCNCTYKLDYAAPYYMRRSTLDGNQTESWYMLQAIYSPQVYCLDNIELYPTKSCNLSAETDKSVGFCSAFKYSYGLPTLIFISVVQVTFLFQLISTCILKKNIQIVYLTQNKENCRVRVADSFGFWLCKTSSLIYAAAGLTYIEYMKFATSGKFQLIQSDNALGLTIYFVTCGGMACNQIFYFIWVKQFESYVQQLQYMNN